MLIMNVQTKLLFSTFLWFLNKNNIFFNWYLMYLNKNILFISTKMNIQKEYLNMYIKTKLSCILLSDKLINISDEYKSS